MGQIFPIRRATPKDAAALSACIDAAYAIYADRITDLPPVSEGCAEDIANHQVWVAVQGHTIIGGLVLIPQGDHLKLANLAVHPAQGGKGIGRALIEHSEHEAKRQGYDKMRLNTHADMPENIALYRHLGWVEVARVGHRVSMIKRLQSDGPAD
jgi:ribosomal protein S18 acetylase RimI-like enzyme